MKKYSTLIIVLLAGLIAFSSCHRPPL